MNRRKLVLIAPILTLSLAVGGTAFAFQGSGSGPHNGAHGYGPGGRLVWAFGRNSPSLGMVQSLTGDVLSVLEFNGTTVTYDVTKRTVYFLNGIRGTSAAVVAGENVVVGAGRWGGWSGGTASTTPKAQVVWLLSPHTYGAIQSITPNLSGDLIIVQDPQGFWHYIQTSSTTVYYVNGTSTSSPPTFTIGEIISALGSVASDHSTLDATQVNVVPAKRGHR